MNLKILAVLLALSSSSAYSASLDYYPGTPLHLGSTFDPTDLSSAYAPCIDFGGREIPLDVRKDVTGPVGMETDFALSQITSRRQLYRYLNISASVSGHYKLFSGGASASIEEEDAFDSDNFTWVIRVYTKYGKFGMESPRLNDAASKLVNEPAAFRTRCGYEYVAQVNRGILAAVVYTVKNLSQSSKRRMEAEFNAKIAGGAWGVEGNAAYKSFIQEALKVGMIELKVFTIGGQGASALSDLEVNTDKIEAVKQVLANYTKDQGPERSAPMSFTTGSLAQFVPKFGMVDFGYYLKVLDEFLFLQEEYRSRARRLYRFILDSGDFFPDGQEENRNALQIYLDRYKALNLEIDYVNAGAQRCRLYITRLGQTAFSSSRGSLPSNALIESRSVRQIRPDEQEFRTLSAQADLPRRRRPPRQDKGEGEDESDDVGSQSCIAPNPNLSLLVPALPAELPFDIQYTYEPLEDPLGQKIFLVYRVVGPSLKNVYLKDAQGSTLEIVSPAQSGNDKVAVGTHDIVALRKEAKMPLQLGVVVRSGREYKVDVPIP